MTELMTRQAPVGSEPAPPFTVRVRFDEEEHNVEMSGELDLASRAAALRACAAVEHRHVLVDLSGLAFMDCAGYDALVASAAILNRRGGSLELMNPIGQPRQLLALIGELDRGLCAPVRIQLPT